MKSKAGSPETEEQSAATKRFDAEVANLDLNDLDLSELDCEVRDRMLDLFKQRPKPWDQMLEGEQVDIAVALQGFGRDLVSAVTLAVAGRGIEYVTATQEKFTYKDGDAVITLKSHGGSDVVMELAKLDGRSVLIVDADASAFYGNKKPATMPDAPELFDEAEPLPPTGEEVDLEQAGEPPVAEPEEVAA
jgi:hypothetical protein